MAWMRLDDTFYDHPKFRKMGRVLGVSEFEAKGHVATLWTWAVRHRPDGSLHDLDMEDIELAAGWGGESGAFVDACLGVSIIDQADGVFELHGYMERAGSYIEARRKRAQRKKKVSQDSPGTVPGQSQECPQHGPGNVPKTRQDRQDKTDIQDILLVKTFIEIPLSKDGGSHKVTEEDFAEYIEAYPAVDVAQELRTIRQWNLANPKNRKTKSGIRRHINAWLAKTQNEAKPKQAAQTLSLDFRTVAVELLGAKRAPPPNAFPPQNYVHSDDLPLIRAEVERRKGLINADKQPQI
jgi:hypothetical protein